MLYLTRPYKIKLWFFISSFFRCEKIAFFLAAQKTVRDGLELRITPSSALVLLLMTRYSSCRHGRDFITLRLLGVLSASQTGPDWIKQKLTQYLYSDLHNFLAHKESEAGAWIGLSCPGERCLLVSPTVTVPFKMRLKNGVSAMESDHGTAVRNYRKGSK